MTALAQEAPRLFSPIVRRARDKVALGLSVDRAIVDGDFLGVAGWTVGGQDLTFTVSGALGVSAPPSLTFYPRDDVAAGYEIANDLVTGFLAIWRNRPSGDMQIRLNAGADDPLKIELRAPKPSSAVELAQFLTENAPRAHVLFEGLLHNPAAAALLAAHLKEPPPTFNRARGHIETARGIEGVGGLVVGWTVGEPDARFRLVDDRGVVVTLSAAARWTRDDIVEAMSRDFGDYAFNAGFLQAWGGGLKMGGGIRLVVSVDDASYRVSEAKWAAAPLDPVSFARWAFDIPTPRERFAERLANHDGAIIDTLIERKRSRRGAQAPIIEDYGRRPARPKCSVVVPLYGRHDFMLNQLLAFSDDPDFVSAVELVYVIDDHRLVSPVAADAPIFAASFGVPFRTIWSGENRGFAGATNLGVKHSTAPYVLLLNSDIIPVAPGWLEEMRSSLAAHPEIGVLGARLHHPNGAVQHDGMTFRWEPNWQAYLNEHPGAGLPAAEANDRLVRHPAVTAACMLLRRKIYEAVGGLDENFLIGDFEDSDICLKVREKGLEIACLTLPVTLIHLERQSFSGIGTAELPRLCRALQRLAAPDALGKGDREGDGGRETEGGSEVKAMVIAHAHPDFNVGGAEIAAYNLFRTLKARPGYDDAIFLARSDLPSLGHGSIMLRRPGEYLWRQDISDWFRLRTLNLRCPCWAVPRLPQDRAAGRRVSSSLCPRRHRGAEGDQGRAAGLPPDPDAARICRDLPSQRPDGEERHEEALLARKPRRLQQLLPGALAAGLLAAQALHPEAFRIRRRLRLALRVPASALYRLGHSRGRDRRDRERAALAACRPVASPQAPLRARVRLLRSDHRIQGRRDPASGDSPHVARGSRKDDRSKSTAPIWSRRAPGSRN